MIFSHTQITQFLRCPRSYRYRYFDGWQEKETRVAMVFGRSFEKALGAYLCLEDSSSIWLCSAAKISSVPRLVPRVARVSILSCANAP
jgi:hypothetical protein